MNKNELKVIDFDTYGNVIRLYLGDINDTDYWGDDWDDTPASCNAGTVYGPLGFIEIAFPSFIQVLIAENDWHYHGNEPFCKDDYKKMKAPCIILVDDRIEGNEYGSEWAYSERLGDKSAWQIYFNDTLTDVINKLDKYNGMIIDQEDVDGEG